MARQCELTGIRNGSGNKISHSHIKTKRRFKANLHKKRIFDVDTNTWIRLTVSTRALRTLRKKSLSSMLAKSPY